MVGIYKITSPSGAVYIGQSWNIKGRFWRYGDKTKWDKQPVLSASFKKHGLKAHKFEVVTILPNDVSQIVLDNYECFYIDLYKQVVAKIMNVRGGGSRGKHSENSKEKIRNTLTGRKRPPEVIEKLKEAALEYRKKGDWIEGCRRGGLAHKGKITSETAKYNLKMAQPTRTPILVLNKRGEIIGFYLSQIDASKKLNIWQADVSQSIIKDKYVKRFKFVKARTQSSNSVIRQQGTNLLAIIKKHNLH